jgi:endo-1,4-beta-xylanase
MRKNPFDISSHCVAATMLAAALSLPVPLRAGETPEAGLKDAFADAFLMGTALNRGQILGAEPDMLALVAQQFNAVTAENVMKWEKIHPEEDRFDWTAPDALVDLASAHGMQVAGHVLVWHQQTPDWVFEGAGGKPASREQLLARMERHIDTVVRRYRGRVQCWEVVNEALNDDGSLRRTPWLEIIGEDYIRRAFEYAQRADPEACLYYNDYNLYKPAKRDGAIRLAKGLLEQGIPVSGIGLQGHYGLGHPENLQDFADTLAAVGALGLEAYITEFDLSVLPFPDEQSRSADLSVNLELREQLNPYADGLPAEVEQRQRERWVALFRILLEHQDIVARVTFWGVSDGQNWKNDWPMRGRTDYPLLFDRQNRPKPAYYEIIGLVR